MRSGYTGHDASLFSTKGPKGGSNVTDGESRIWVDKDLLQVIAVGYKD
jgi:hypothetical protein